MRAKEHEIQCALFQWAGLQAKTIPALALMFAIPNESYGNSKRDMLRGLKFKKEGRKAGVPDIFLPVASRGKHGLFLEMKSSTGRISDKQKAWLTALHMQQYETAVAYSLDEAIKIIKDYLQA